VHNQEQRENSEEEVEVPSSKQIEHRNDEAAEYRRHRDAKDAEERRHQDAIDAEMARHNTVWGGEFIRHDFAVSKYQHWERENITAESYQKEMRAREKEYHRLAHELENNTHKEILKKEEKKHKITKAFEELRYGMARGVDDEKLVKELRKYELEGVNSKRGACWRGCGFGMTRCRQPASLQL